MWLVLSILSIAITVPRYIQFNRSKYKEVSGENFYQITFSKMSYANYSLYRQLRAIGVQYIVVNYPVSKTLRIPLICITSKGIFVFGLIVEEGLLVGDEYKSDWSITKHTKQSISLENPFITNRKYIKLLKGVLQRQIDWHYHSVIVVSERTDISELSISSVRTLITSRHTLRQEVKKLGEKAESVLTKQEQRQIFEQLQKNPIIHSNLDAGSEQTQSNIIQLKKFQ